MKATRVLSAALIAAALVGCSQEEQLDLLQESKMQFSGSFEQVASRVVLNDDYTMSWEENVDQVSIFPGLTVNNQYLTGSVTDGRASFTFVDYVDPTSGYDKTTNNLNYAVYPYAKGNTITADGTITTSVPATFEYEGMQKSIRTALMAAKSSNTSLNFKNVQGILRLRLSAEQPLNYGPVASIVLTSKENSLSGAVTITFDEDGLPVATVNGGKTLTIDLSEELPLVKKGKGYSEFYLPMIPAQFAAKDLKLTINWADDSVEDYTVDVPISINIERRKIYTLTHSIAPNNNFDGALEDDYEVVWDGETITIPTPVTDDVTGDTYYPISKPSDLAGIAALVNGTTTSRAATTSLNIKLENDIDLNGANWTPIGYNGNGDWNNVFEGTFDGQGHTISNLYINTPEGDGVGLFGVAQNATIKNITVKNANVTGNSMVAAIIGSPYTNCTVSNCHLIGNINLIAEYAYVGGIAAYGYVNIDNCSVIADGTGIINAKNRNAVGGICAWLLENNNSITNCQVKNLEMTGWANIGSITGFVHYNNEISNCKAENIVLNKTRIDGKPSIGALAGGWCYGEGKTIVIKNIELKDITMNGTHSVYSFEDKELFGSEYGGDTRSNFVKENITTENIKNNLVEGYYAKSLTELQALINNPDAHEINLTADIEGTVVMKSNVTINGNGNLLGSVNLNGADNVTLKDITFDAAKAVPCVDGQGNYKVYANIMTGVWQETQAGKGAFNLVIDNCTFTGAFKTGKPGSAIAFADDERNGGYSGNITIKNCTFDTVTDYGGYDIYGYYIGNEINGYGKFVIEGNTFKSTRPNGMPVYLGQYASSVPVEVKNNTFETVNSLNDAVYVQDHSNYGVSIDSSNNTFAN